MENGNTRRRGKPIPWLSGQIPWNKGKKGYHVHTEEHKKQLSGKMKGHKVWGGNGTRFQEGHRFYKGGEKGWFRKGQKTWNKGLAKETDLRVLGGNNHYNWQGGISFEPYSVDWTRTLRRSIRERDNYICRKCSQYGNIVHHIDYDKKNCNPDNLITLCIGCNTKVNYHRKYWERYFRKLLDGK